MADISAVVGVLLAERGPKPVVAASWDEAKHPREPSGTPEGGQFAPYFGARIVPGEGYQAFRMLHGEKARSGVSTDAGPVRETLAEADRDANAAFDAEKARGGLRRTKTGDKLAERLARENGPEGIKALWDDDPRDAVATVLDLNNAPSQATIERAKDAVRAESRSALQVKYPHGFITVYRGGEGNQNLSAWSLDRETALFFARGDQDKVRQERVPIAAVEAYLPAVARGQYRGYGEQEVLLPRDMRIGLWYLNAAGYLEEVTAAAWDESKHPREPGGKPEGGQFAHASSGFSRENAEATDLAMSEIWGRTSAGDVDYDEREMAKIEVMNTIAQKLEGDEDFLSLLGPLARPEIGSTTSTPEQMVELFEGRFPQADTPEKLTAALAISYWARTSGDSDPTALQFQIAAEQEFGLKAHPFVHEQWAEEQLEGLTWNEQQQAGARKFLRAQYEATQEMLKATGLKEVTLYRGMRWGATDVPPEIKALVGPPSLERIAEPQYAQKMMKISQNPLSSWSWDNTTASLFSHGTTYGAVLGTRVPIDRVLSTPYTGFGALHEGEFVVLGDEGMEAYAEVRRQSDGSSMRDGFLAGWEKTSHARA